MTTRLPLQARALLEADGFDVVGEAERRDAPASRRPASLRPDLVLLDIGLPDIEGFEVARELAVDGPPPLVVLTSSREAERLRAAPRRQPGPRVHPEGRALRRRDPGTGPGA